MSATRSGAPVAVPSTPVRHLLNRFSYGITPALLDDVAAAGGHLAWFEQQLATAYDGSPDELCDWWPHLRLDPALLWERAVSRELPAETVVRDYRRRALLRRITSPRQVLEVMTDFWENHLHVPATTTSGIFAVRAAYGDVIRAHALGRFEDLLCEAIQHPAMLTYLGALGSTKTHPNENLARELLELHTVGVGTYSEDDVKDSARILTGFRTGPARSGTVTYDPRRHWTGPVTVLEFSDPNRHYDGRRLVPRYLSFLARHPATARRLATKLVQAFVSDVVPPALVERLARCYLDHDTAIVPVLRELVAAPEFGQAVGALVRDPERDVVATYRALGVEIGEPRTDFSAARRIDLQAESIGLAPFAWPSPDGRPLRGTAWTSPMRVLASMKLHWAMARGTQPALNARLRRADDWLPRRSAVELREVVDHVSRVVLQRPASRVLVDACCAATGQAARARLAPGAGVTRACVPKVLVTVLDSPDFYHH